MISSTRPSGAYLGKGVDAEAHYDVSGGRNLFVCVFGTFRSIADISPDLQAHSVDGPVVTLRGLKSDMSATMRGAGNRTKGDFGTRAGTTESDPKRLGTFLSRAIVVGRAALPGGRPSRHGGWPDRPPFDIGLDFAISGAPARQVALFVGRRARDQRSGRCFGVSGGYWVVDRSISDGSCPKGWGTLGVTASRPRGVAGGGGGDFPYRGDR